MFTGIIESAAKVVQLKKKDTNLHLSLHCDLTSELKIDQSVAHNGVCLTVVAIDGNQYTVTAIEETLNKTNIGHLQEGDIVNIERAMKCTSGRTYCTRPCGSNGYLYRSDQ